MNNRYKLIISNKKIFKEIELYNEYKTSIKAGTTKNCDVRFNKDDFFTEFEITFDYLNGYWQVCCDDNIYITSDGIMKLPTKTLEHGDDLILKYKESNQDIFKLSFTLDFDYNKKDYDRIIEFIDCDEIVIGGGSKCDIQLQNSLMGNNTVVLKKKNGRLTLIDNNTKYGVFVNGIKINGLFEIKDYDFFSILEYSFYFKHSKVYTSKNSDIIINSLNYYDVSEVKSRFAYPKYNRSTRIKSIVPTDLIDILDPPEQPHEPKNNLVMSLIPALSMLALTVVLRGVIGGGGTFVIFSACSMGLGIFTSIMSFTSEKKKYKKDIIERKRKYSEYINNKRVEISKLRDEELQVLEGTYYSSEKIIQHVNDFSSSLFDRSSEDLDFLHIRVGTGALLSNRQLDYKKQERLDTDDALADIPGQIALEYKYINKAPIVVRLSESSAIGVVGSTSQLYDMFKIMVLDLSVRQYYNDIKMFFIFDSENVEQMEWIRFLPHIQSYESGLRNIIHDDDSRSSLFEHLYKELSRRESEKIKYPGYVVFVYNDVGIKRHPLSKYIENAIEYGFTFIFFEEYMEMLPKGCQSIIMLDKNDSSGQVVDSSDSTQSVGFSYDEIEDVIAKDAVLRLAPVYCEEISLEGSLTKNISLFELLKIAAVDDLDIESRWKSSEVYKTMAAPLGVKSKNEIVYLDLNEKHHGPHGLVAGTTGSGKSEILQSYILSMATLFHPYEVSFVIIDFKGGGMVNQFKDLPHLIGAITNIDGREINRSLLSIKAELRKRQEYFAQYGVNHIDSYIRLYKKGETPVPIPHLILIVDEFAELKMDQPEFMKELISAARIGRSLGVHLILATQKPSGVVNAQIWSNSKFKLCLKVQNKEDSNEVIKTPLAAEIKEPGRAYLQVGNNEIFDLFQSAYSGAPANTDTALQKKSFVISTVSLSGKRTPVYVKKISKSDRQSETQLEAIVSYINGYCEGKMIKHLPGICMPPLEDIVYYIPRKLKKESGKTIIPLGIYDDPDNQCQNEANLDLTSGNTIIIGASQYGKTSLLQLLIRCIGESYSPREVSIYIMDFGSLALNVFEDMNHIGGIITPTNDEKLKNFVRMLRHEIKNRKEVFSQIGVTSFTSYKEAGNTDLPHIVLMVDNYLAFKELFAEYEEDMINFSREGIGVGISIIITSQHITGLGYKLLGNYMNRIGLYSFQRDDYGALFDRCRMEPKNVPGRGLISIDKTIYEYQTYLAFEGEKEIDRVGAIKEFIKVNNKANQDVRARRIPEVPQILDIDYVQNNYGQSRAKPYQIPVGIDYDTVEFATIDLSKILMLSIAGRESSGKTNLVKILMNYLQQHIFDFPSKAYIIDDYERQLNQFNSYGVVEKYTVDAGDFELILTEMEQELIGRMDLLKESGLDALEQEPLLLCVLQNNTIFSAGGLSKEGVDTFKRITKNYRQLKVCFVFAVENVAVPFGAPELLKIVKENKNLFVFDDLTNLKFNDVTPSVAKQYKKLIELGDAFFISDKGTQKLKTIHSIE
jgi:S-DNA-T family DNA segregation ATPase FtsK/SpoIIIE